MINNNDYSGLIPPSNVVLLAQKLGVKVMSGNVDFLSPQECYLRFRVNSNIILLNKKILKSFSQTVENFNKAFKDKNIQEVRKGLDSLPFYKVIGVAGTMNAEGTNCLWVKQGSIQGYCTDINNGDELRNKFFMWDLSFIFIKNNVSNINKSEINFTDKTSLLQRISNSFKDQQNCDVFFIKGSERIGAHKLILSVHVQYFNTLFNKKSEDTDPLEFPIPEECSLEEFKDLLEYLYSGDVKINANNLVGLAYLADYYQIDALNQFLCNKASIAPLLSPDNLVKLYERLYFYSLKDLKVVIEEFLLKAIFFPHSHNSLEDLIFQLNYQSLNQLLSKLYMHSLQLKERDVFFVLDKWIKNQGHNLTSEQIKSLFGHVHFERLSLDDLWKIVQPTGYFSNDELSSISGSIVNYQKQQEKSQISYSSLKRKAEEIQLLNRPDASKMPKLEEKKQ